MKVDISRSQRRLTCYSEEGEKGRGCLHPTASLQGLLRLEIIHLSGDMVGGHFCCGTFLSMRWLFPRRLEKVGSLCKSELLQGNFNKEPKECGCSNTIIKIKDQ